MKLINQQALTPFVVIFCILIALFSIVQGSPSRPNIILIMADDLGVEGIGTYGSKEFKTPTLDTIAREGFKFNHAYSQPICTPSRVQIMTGRYNHRNYTGFGTLDPDEITFGNVLRDADYQTCIAGKWQLGGDASTPKHFGFDEYCLWFLYPPENMPGGKPQGRRYWEPFGFIENGHLKKVKDDAYGPNLVCQFITDFIDRSSEKETPFFIYFPMLLTHAPFDPTPHSRNSDQREWSQAKYINDAYLADMVAYMDFSVSRIVETLEANGLRQNTLLIFTSDNGTDQNAVIQTLTGAVRGGKGLMIKRGTHVPFIVSWPALQNNKREIDALVDFSDLLPTFAAVAQTPLPSDRIIDGHSFLPILKGEQSSVREWLFSHYWKNGRQAQGARNMIYNHRWKLYDNNMLHDLLLDPEEQNPLSADALPELRQYFKTELSKVLAVKKHEE